jgi:hypothetical protein
LGLQRLVALIPTPIFSKRIFLHPSSPVPSFAPSHSGHRVFPRSRSHTRSSLRGLSATPGAIYSSSNTFLIVTEYNTYLFIQPPPRALYKRTFACCCCCTSSI